LTFWQKLRTSKAAHEARAEVEHDSLDVLALLQLPHLFESGFWFGRFGFEFWGFGVLGLDFGFVLNSRTSASQKCAAVPRRARRYKAHRLWYHSTIGSKVIKKRGRFGMSLLASSSRISSSLGSGLGVSGFGFGGLGVLGFGLGVWAFWVWV